MELNGLIKLVVVPEQAISVRLPSGDDRVIPFDPSATLAQFAQQVRLDRGRRGQQYRGGAALGADFNQRAVHDGRHRDQLHEADR